MRLHELKLTHKNKPRKRVGRGGKRGTYSGRGIKGQKSRAGRRIRPAERDLILRLPKRRGVKNKPKSTKPTVLNLKALSLALKSRVSDKQPLSLNKSFLKEAGLLPARFRGDVKILGGGEIETAVRVEDLKVSASAKEKIEKAGGKVLARERER